MEKVFLLFAMENSRDVQKAAQVMLDAIDFKPIKFDRLSSLYNSKEIRSQRLNVTLASNSSFTLPDLLFRNF
jgi:hypothetical protein